MKKIVLLISFLFFVSYAWAEKLPYKTFYLGINPNSKIPIIKDFLSADGKLYRLPNGSIFVKDKANVLKEIEGFLKNDPALAVPQVRVSLKNLNTGKSDRFQSDIGIKYEKGKGGSIKIRGGTSGAKVKKNQISEIMTISGKSAEIAVYKTTDELKVYRTRFVDIAYRKHLREGTALIVKPTVQGKLVIVQLRSVYWAVIQGKRRQFETGEIRTSVYSKPGNWHQIGGVSSASSAKKRGNVFLSIKDNKSINANQIMLKTEIIKPIYQK